MLDPAGLYAFADDQPSAEDLGTPPMVFSLQGFIDAGQAGRLATEHLLSTLEHRLLVSFDLDQVYDYRARRPLLTFDQDHWEAYAQPRLDLHLARDADGTPFLLLIGPEPDLQWDRFCAAVVDLVRHYRVRLSVGMHAIPMGVPHTRPAGVIAHATRPDLVAGHRHWIGRVQVPGHLTGLLEYRLGESGQDAAGFAVQVPHYLAQNEYPASAQAMLDAVAALTGLRLPTQALATAAEQVAALIAEQIVDSAEVQAMVSSLEEQYDALVADPGPMTAMPEDLPTADELGAELERFLAAENERRGRGDG